MSCFSKSGASFKNSIMENLTRWVVDEAADKGIDYNVNDNTQWKCELADCPKQKTSLDCGVFVIKYADCISQNLKFDFDQSNMNFIRSRLCMDILNGKLISDVGKYSCNEEYSALSLVESTTDKNIENHDNSTKLFNTHDVIELTEDNRDRRELNTDDENEPDSEWVSKRGQNYVIVRYGNAALVVGREFSFTQYGLKNHCNLSGVLTTDIFKFTDIVVKRGDAQKTLFLKYYSVDKFRNLTTVPTNEWLYIEAVKVLSTNKKKYVQLKTVVGEENTYYGHALVGRVCRTSFGEAGIFKGTITNYDSKNDKYIVRYCDNDVKDHSLREILEFLRIE